jgi:hypothetical protein
MTLNLALPPDLEDRLRREAERCGQPNESVALTILDKHLPARLDEKRAAAIAMLTSWMKEDETLQPDEEAANADVLRKLDEDRPSYRKLFANIAKDGSQ